MQLALRGTTPPFFDFRSRGALIMKLFRIDLGMKITDQGEDLSLNSEVSDKGFLSQGDMRKPQLWDRHLKTQRPTVQ
jgi:hypothetical protein